MRLRPSTNGSIRDERLWVILAFVLSATVRTTFALSFPTIHGGDAAARLASPTTLILGYQLPLPQAFVMLGKGVADDPIVVRIIFCLWGAVLVSGLTALAAQLAGPTAALVAGLLASFDPLLIHYSIVPYQEPVAYGLLAWAFFFAYSDRPGTAALLMSGACLSRYEAWLFLPAFAALTRSRWTTLAAAPMVMWIMWWRGLAPRGLYVVDVDPGASRLPRVVYLAGKFLEYETAVFAVLAFAALVLFVARRERLFLRVAAMMAAVITLMIAFGHEYPAGTGHMSERLISLPVLMGLILIAGGFARLAPSLVVRGAILLVIVALCARDLRFERTLLQAAAIDPDLAIARDVARSLESMRRAGECVTVTAPPVDRALLDAYVGKVGRSFGDVERARERAGELAQTAPDRDRVAANLRSPAGIVQAASGCPLVVTFDTPTDGAPGLVGDTVAVIRAGPRIAQIVRIR